MAIIIMLVLLILFIMIILLGLLFKKKIWLYLIIGMAVIAGSTFIIKNTILYYNSNTISVAVNERESFEIKIKNHNIRSEWDVLKFSCKYSKKELFDKVSKQYERAFFDELFDQIVIISGNKIFTISCMGNSNFLWHKEKKYILMENHIFFDTKSAIPELESVKIPFPPMVVISDRSLAEENMKLKCDFNHLKQYYKDFTNVEIGENTIEIMLKNYKCIMTVNGNDIHFELMEIEE